MDSIEEKLALTNKEILNAQEKIISNNQSISKYNQLEETVHEIDMQERRIEARLFETWKKDRDFAMKLD